MELRAVRLLARLTRHDRDRADDGSKDLMGAEGRAATRTAVADEVQWILERERANGGPFWSRADGSIHAPAGFSTLLVLNVLGELGTTRLTHPLIAAAAEFVFGYQCDDGAFRYTPRSSKLACIAGQALAGLGRLEAAGGERAEAGFRWLLDSQRGDGGWRCPMVRPGASAQTDASNPGATIFVLDAFRFRRNSPGDDAALRGGVDSLLRHWQTRQPLGPCRFGIGSRFLAVEYPFWRYNLLYYVYVLAHYPQARADARFAEAVRQLSAHVNAAGEMVVDAPPRAWQGRPYARKDAPSELATRRWQQIQALLTRGPQDAATLRTIRVPFRRRPPWAWRPADYEPARSSHALTFSYLHKWLARHAVQFPLDRVFAKWHARCGLAAIDRD